MAGIAPANFEKGLANSLTPFQCLTVYVDTLRREYRYRDDMAYCVYIVQSEKDGTYYVGHTDNLGERLDRHNSGRSIKISVQ